MAASKSKTSFAIKRLVNFFKIFLTNKRGVLGLAILVVSSTIAIIAPLIAPNDPVQATYVAGDFAAPIWLKWFSGEQGFTENLQLTNEPGFPTMTSVTNEWNFTSASENIGIAYEQNVGSPVSGPGSAEILFRRLAGYPLVGSVEAHLTSKKPLNFPYESPPKLFICDMSIQASGVENLQAVYVTLSIRLVENGTSYVFWHKKFTSSQNWTQPLISSYSRQMKNIFSPTDPTIDPARVVFSQPDQYVLDILVYFEDMNPDMDEKKVETAICIDDLNLKLYGTAYGILGTDHWGRDIWSQMVYGARISLFVGLFAAFIGVVIGLIVGLAAGYVGFIVDEILMRSTDILLVLPTLPLLLVLIAVLGPSLVNLIILIGFLGWMGFARVVRSQVLSLKERPFIEAAKAVGAGKFHIITKHVLPNVMSLVYVSLALSVPSAILMEAALSFLGLFDPTVISWGRMLHDAQAIEGGLDKWWWWLPPGLAIALVSVSFILLGYAIDEILNPKLRKRR
ncbi:ABC transporter permease [Candidatus Bathyarchaeota archaeon]|nr:ABC transporter permease [Candidatus Bathyarchaeota archaeon]